MTEARQKVCREESSRVPSVASAPPSESRAWLESKLYCCCKKAVLMEKSQLFCLDIEVSEAARNHPCAAEHSSNIRLGQDLDLLLLSPTVSPAV